MYKVIHSEFRGYVKMIFHNVTRGHFFYLFAGNFNPIWNQTTAEIISAFEESSEKFYSLEDAEESLGRIVERMCGYKNGIIPMADIFTYNTFQVHPEDVKDVLKEVKDINYEGQEFTGDCPICGEKVNWLDKKYDYEHEATVESWFCSDCSLVIKVNSTDYKSPLIVETIENLA